MSSDNDYIIPQYDPINESTATPQTTEPVSPNTTADSLELADWSTVFQNHELIKKITSPSATVTQVREVFQRKEVVEDEPIITLPQIPRQTLDAVSATLPDESINLEDEKVADWFRTVGMADASEQSANQFQGSLAREGSDWQQGLRNGDSLLSVSRLRIRDSQTEDRGVLRVISSLGMGGLFSLPLWHSGFWVTLKTPQNSALMDLEMRIIREKKRFARQTYGRAFSNTTAFASGLILDFVMEHIHSTNLDNREAVRDLILAQDLHILAWELACIIYPRGFNYRRPILGDRDSTYKYIEERIDVTEMNWTDNSAFTAEQRTHMSKRSSTVTIDEVKRYQEQFAMSAGSSFRLSEGDVALEEQTYIHLKTPTAAQHVDMGLRWINDISHTYDTISTSGRTVEDRDRYIESQAASTILRRYEHYVDRIVIRTPDGSEDVIDGAGAKSRILDYLSTAPDYRKRFTDEVRQFIDNSMISVIGVPVYDAKEREAMTPLPRHPYIIPVDPISVFFTLLIQRNNIMRARAID